MEEESAVFWFKEDPPQTYNYLARKPSMPWIVVRESEVATGAKQYAGVAWPKRTPGTVGVILYACPTNPPTLTFAFYPYPPGGLTLDKDLKPEMLLGKITVQNPAFR